MKGTHYRENTTGRWEKIGNNQGVFQGSPISALLYITFADGIMDEYTETS